MLRSVRSLVPLAALVLAAAASACDGGPTIPPVSLEGTFGLAEANARPLPALLWTDGVERLELVDDRLTFEVDGRVRQKTTFRRTGRPAGVVQTETASVETEYHLDGDGGLVLGSLEPCAPDAICIGNDVGEVEGRSRIRLESQRFLIASQPARLLYVRL